MRLLGAIKGGTEPVWQHLVQIDDYSRQNSAYRSTFNNLNLLTCRNLYFYRFFLVKFLIFRLPFYKLNILHYTNNSFLFFYKSLAPIKFLRLFNYQVILLAVYFFIFIFTKNLCYLCYNKNIKISWGFLWYDEKVRRRILHKKLHRNSAFITW